VVKPSERLNAGIAKVSGTIRSHKEATLGTKITAQVRAVHVEIGDRVKAGQRLVTLDPTNATIALSNAQAAERAADVNVKNAKIELERTKALRAENAVPEATLERAQAAADAAAAQLDQARAMVRQARQQITDATIVAPFEGVISARMVSEGTMVTSMPPTQLLSITDIDHLEVKLAVPEALAPLANAGETLSGRASPGETPFTAKVRIAAPTVDPQTRTVEVLADVAPGPGIRPGALVVVDLSKAEGLVGPFLPTSAIREENGKSFVLVLVKGKLERREVSIEKIDPGTVRARGVTPADQVVADPDDTLRAGDAASVLEG
jgi:RND family efflux transporter MFP subunit